MNLYLRKEVDVFITPAYEVVQYSRLCPKLCHCPKLCQRLWHVHAVFSLVSPLAQCIMISFFRWECFIKKYFLRLG